MQQLNFGRIGSYIPQRNKYNDGKLKMWGFYFSFLSDFFFSFSFLIPRLKRCPHWLIIIIFYFGYNFWYPIFIFVSKKNKKKKKRCWKRNNNRNTKSLRGEKICQQQQQKETKKKINNIELIMIFGGLCTPIWPSKANCQFLRLKVHGFCWHVIWNNTTFFPYTLAYLLFISKIHIRLACFSTASCASSYRSIREMATDISRRYCRVRRTHKVSASLLVLMWDRRSSLFHLQWFQFLLRTCCLAFCIFFKFYEFFSWVQLVGETVDVVEG